MALEFDSGAATPQRYLYGPAVDQILADEQSNGNVMWALTDNEGSVRDLVNSWPEKGTSLITASAVG